MKKTSQQLNLSTNSSTTPKKDRIELRAFKEAFPLNLVSNLEKKEIEHSNLTKSKLKRISTIAISEQIYLKKILEYMKKEKMFKNGKLYCNECLCADIVDINTNTNINNINILDSTPTNNNTNNNNNNNINNKIYKEKKVFFFDYGVIVFWGLSQPQESSILLLIRKFLSNPYPIDRIETECFNYLDSSTSYFINDIFYLSNSNTFNKMVISHALAQSVKLDYFESLMDELINLVKPLPLSLENYGHIKCNKQKIYILISRIHLIRFDLNLVSNILDAPEILWQHSEYNLLYKDISTCMEVRMRAELLNKRIDTIQSFLMLAEREKRSNKKNVETMFKLVNIGLLGMIFVLLLVKLNKL